MTTKFSKFILILSFFLTSCSTTASSSPTSEPIITDTLNPPTSTPLPTPIQPQFTEELNQIAGTEIMFWYVWNHTGEDPIQAAVSNFNLINDYGIAVQAINQVSLRQNDTAITINLGSEALPNIAVGIPSQYLTWESYGDLVVDLTPYIGDAEVGLDLTNIQSALWQQDQINNKHYGIPAERYANVIFYNQTWAQELGFDTAPSMLEEFKQQTCSGGWIIDQDPGTILSWLYAFDGAIVTEAGYRFNTPEMEAVLNFIVELKDEECAWRPLTPFPNDDFALREALFYAGSTRGISAIQNSFEEAKNADKWVAILFPEDIITVSGTSYVMLASTPQEQLATWLFMRYLLDSEVNAKIVSATNSFPLYTTKMESWQTDLLNNAYNEPQLRSWVRVRPMLNDAVAQLFDFNFVPEDIPGILQEMQTIADELAEAMGDN